MRPVRRGGRRGADRREEEGDESSGGAEGCGRSVVLRRMKQSTDEAEP